MLVSKEINKKHRTREPAAGSYHGGATRLTGTLALAALSMLLLLTIPGAAEAGDAAAPPAGSSGTGVAPPQGGQGGVQARPPSGAEGGAAPPGKRQDGSQGADDEGARRRAPPGCGYRGNDLELIV